MLSRQVELVSTNLTVLLRWDTLNPKIFPKHKPPIPHQPNSQSTASSCPTSYQTSRNQLHAAGFHCGKRIQLRRRKRRTRLWYHLHRGQKLVPIRTKHASWQSPHLLLPQTNMITVIQELMRMRGQRSYLVIRRLAERLPSWSQLTKKPCPGETVGENRWTRSLSGRFRPVSVLVPNGARITSHLRTRNGNGWKTEEEREMGRLVLYAFRRRISAAGDR